MMKNYPSCEYEVLLSCMHQESFEIAYKSKINSDLLIINQCDREDYQEIEVNGFLWRMISTKERGLSRSRNLAVYNARGTICQLCDDDEILEDGYREMVLKAFDELPEASIIGFNVHRINVAMKKNYYIITSTKETDSYRSFASPMVAFRLKDIKDRNIQFNEQFGSGTLWGPGEDTLFQKNARSAGLKLFEYPKYLATQDYSNESKWFHGYTQEYFYQQGAFAEYCGEPRLKRVLYALYSSFIKLRKEKTLSPIQKIVWRMKGEKGWRENVTYSQYVENGYCYKPRKQ